MTLEKDMARLKKFQKEFWETFEDRTGKWVQDLPIDKSAREEIREIIRRREGEFIFEPGSGVFGFGISMSVYRHIRSPYPLVPEELDHLITVTGKQMFPDDNAMNRTNSYDFVKRYAYTQHNQARREQAGRIDKLPPLAHYDY